MRINQILWIINNESKSVVPVKIVEKITKETLEGERIEFVVESVQGKRKNLSEMKVTYFETHEDARKHLLDSAINLIDGIISRAIEISEKFSDDSVVHENQPSDTIQEGPSPELVILPDGSRARLRIRDLEVS